MKVPSNKTTEVFDFCVRELSAIYDAGEATNIVRILFEEYCGMDRAALALKKSDTINESELLLVYDAIKELKAFRPVQYVVGKVSFYGLTLSVDPSVLIPRPETEEMVSIILKEEILRSKPVNILDIGTGSGCIAIALKNELKHARITAVDSSDDALLTAAANARRHSAEITFTRSDILDAGASLPDDLTLIVSNPPYVRASEKIRMRPNVLQHEPSAALFVPDDDPLKFYDAIFRLAASHLRPDGLIYTEINEQLAEETAALARQKYDLSASVIRDLFGKERFIRCTHRS